MKKLTMIFGGTVEFYKWAGVFDSIEKKFKCELRRVAINKIVGRIKNVNIEMFFCLSPYRDHQYDWAKEFLAVKRKVLIPPPANETVKKIKNSDLILFLGLCGGFKGKKGDIYIPEEFKEIDFKGNFIKDKEILKAKPKNKVTIDNFLRRRLKGKKARVITSNATLSPKQMENQNKESLIKIAKILLKYGEVVEKETCQIVKALKKKAPLGVMLMASDVLHIKKHMLDHDNFSPDRGIFKKNALRAVKICLEELK